MRRRDPYVVAGGLAVVTGAASGIGAALALELAEEGSHLALVDRDKDALLAGAERLARQHPGITVTSHPLDLTDTGAAEELRAQVLAQHGAPTLVVNNAGVALAGRFEQVTMEDVDWLLAVNLHAVMHVTWAFLPSLRRGAHIANVSSLFGIVAPSGQAAYCASKFGVRGFSLSLAGELAPRGIGVTCVHPGGINTAIARSARRGAGLSEDEWNRGLQAFERFLLIEPAVAARSILRGIRRRKARVLIGPESYVGDALTRLAPVAGSAIFDRLARARAGL